MQDHVLPPFIILGRGKITSPFIKFENLEIMEA